MLRTSMRRCLRGPADYEVCFGALPLPTGEGGRRPGEGHKVREYCAPHPALRGWEKDSPTNFCQLGQLWSMTARISLTPRKTGAHRAPLQMPFPKTAPPEAV